MAARDPVKRRKIRALEAARDTLKEKKDKSMLDLKKIAAELKTLRKR